MTAPLRCNVPGCGEPTDDRDGYPRRCTTHFSNPWAGKQLCPRCLSSRWTMPVGPATPLAWRCLTCKISLRATPFETAS